MNVLELNSAILERCLKSVIRTLPSLPAVQTMEFPASRALRQVISAWSLGKVYSGSLERERGSSRRRESSDDMETIPSATSMMS